MLGLALAVATLAGVSAQDRSTIPPPETIGFDRPVPVDPRITIGYLANGLRYYVRANGRPYQRAELRLVVNAGSVLEDNDQRGLAHFIEHMAFDGSEHFAKQDLITFMESIGMRLGPGVNANTSFDETVFVLHVPTDTPEAMRKAFLFFADIAHGLSFDPDAIEKERGVIVEEWRQGRGADARMQDEETPILLKGSRYAERNPIGGREPVETFKPAALKRFYKDWYRPDLMAVIAVGDFEKAQVETMIRDQFGSLPVPADRKPRPSYPVPDHAETLYAIATDPEATMTTVALYNMLPLREQATVGSYRQHQVERLYTGMLNARLAELTLKPDAPFMRAGVDRGIFVKTKEAAVARALVKDDGILRGLSALVTESERAAKFGFTAGELEREKAEMLRGYESAFAERDKEESADSRGRVHPRLHPGRADAGDQLRIRPRPALRAEHHARRGQPCGPGVDQRQPRRDGGGAEEAGAGRASRRAAGHGDEGCARRPDHGVRGRVVVTAPARHAALSGLGGRRDDARPVRPGPVAAQ